MTRRMTAANSIRNEVTPQGPSCGNSDVAIEAPSWSDVQEPMTNRIPGAMLRGESDPGLTVGIEPVVTTAGVTPVAGPVLMVFTGHLLKERI